MSEYIADSAALTYTADRIRAKTGGTDPITWDVAKGFGAAVDAIQAGGSGVDIVITSTITNAEEFAEAITNSWERTQLTFACKTYKNGAPANNQAICGSVVNRLGNGVRYRDGAYAPYGSLNSEYDLVATIGDIYTIWEFDI